MKRIFEIIVFCFAWFAIIAQFVLMIQNRQTDIPETIIRFFSFFTILTNLLVALFFTVKVFKLNSVPFKLFSAKGSITAITAFIVIVGLVYQLVLRHIWQPTGLQWVVDELLHTIIPIYMLIYWYVNIKRTDLEIKPLLYWLLYPVFFIIFVLIRGHFSGYYPYPFLNVVEIGYEKTLLHTGLIFGATLATLTILISIGNKILKT